MGCTPSKQSVCRNCNARCSPVRRSYSSHPHRSPPREADNHHTLGYLMRLDTSTKPNQVRKDPAVARVVPHDPQPVRRNAPEKLIDEKINKTVQKTPVGSPPDEPETINAWELMEGLDDASPLHPPSTTVDNVSCFSFNMGPHSTPLDQSPLPLQEKDVEFVENHPDSDSNLNDTSIASDFDPNANNIKPLINEKQHSKRLTLYFTSLRGVRKTYEDCCHVKLILKNAGFRVDERDVSMHSGFKEELRELLGNRYGGAVGLPKVFMGRRYIGGADEIRRFHDEFQLDKVLEGCELVVECGGGGGCEACGDIRFLPCDKCSGSCKIYYEVKSCEGECENEKEEDEESDYGFQRCPDCNENGLIRCPICCDQL